MGSAKVTLEFALELNLMLLPILLPNFLFRSVINTQQALTSISESENTTWNGQLKPVNPKGNQPWILTGRTDAEAEVSVLQPPDVKSQLTGKDPDAGKDWRQGKKEMTEDEMFGWHHQLIGHEFEEALWVGDGQGSLACCSPWGHEESDKTEQLNWTMWLRSLCIVWIADLISCILPHCFQIPSVQFSCSNPLEIVLDSMNL